MAEALIATAIIGTGVSIYGAVSSAQAQGEYADAMSGYYSQMAELQAAQRQEAYRQARAEQQVYQENARLQAWEAKIGRKSGEYNQLQAETEGVLIRDRAEDAAAELRREKSALQGTQVTSYLKSGVLLEGTPALVIRDSSAQAELDIAKVLESGDREAANAEAQGAIAKMQAEAGALSSEASSQLQLRMGRAALAAGRAAQGLASWDRYSANFQSAAVQSQASLAKWSSVVSSVGSGLTSLGNLGLRFYAPTGKTTTGNYYKSWISAYN